MNKMKLTVLAAALIASSGAAVAATQGSLGTTSTGTSVVTIIKDDAVQITKVDDINLGTPGFLTAPAVGSDDVCIFSSTGLYDIAVTSTNAMNLQTLGGDAIPYSLSWNAAAFAPGSPLLGLAANSTALDCGSALATNATFEVTVLAADFNGAPTGSYTDTLTFLVSPQ